MRSMARRPHQERYISILYSFSLAFKQCKKQAREEGLGEDRIEFEIASSTNFPFPIQAVHHLPSMSTDTFWP